MRPATVMIVDNEPLEASELQRILADDGYSFVVTTTASEARERIHELRDDLSAVLVDWDMAGDEGLQLLRWIKGDEGIDAEVVVHSASLDPGQVKAGIESGAYYYLTKPFEEEQLEAIIRAAVSTYRLRAGLKERVQDTEDAFQLLDFGRFRFRTIRQGDLIAVHIASACGQPEAVHGIRELMVNAVEHGNLCITYEEKSTFMADGSLDRERQRRLSLPEHVDKRVEVTLQRIPSALEVTIRDRGDGFDFQRFMKMDEERLLDLHGRGVLMACMTMEVEYMPPGNQVRVRLPVIAA